MKIKNIYLKRLFFTEHLVFRLPGKKDILLYDDAGSTMLKEYIPTSKMGIFYTRNESINIIILIVSLFKKGPLKENYIDNYIKFSSAKILISFIDNSVELYKIKSRNRLITLIIIQNGYRTYTGEFFECRDYKKKKLNADYLLVFGDSIGKEYLKSVEGNVIDIGSFRNNFYTKNLVDKKKYKISFISQFRDMNEIKLGSSFISRRDFFDKPDQFVLNFLCKYVENLDEKLFIILNSGWYKNKGERNKEIDYYNRLTDGKCEFLESIDNSSSYKSVDMSEVSVTIDSTLGYESAARGNRTVFFPIRSFYAQLDDYVFGWPKITSEEAGKIWANNPDSTIFKQILDYVLGISDQDYIGVLKSLEFNEIIQFDPGNNKLKILLQEIYEK